MKEPIGMLMVCGPEGRAMGMVLVGLVGLVGRAHAHLVRMRRGGDRFGACFAVAVSEDLQNQHPRTIEGSGRFTLRSGRVITARGLLRRRRTLWRIASSTAIAILRLAWTAILRGL